VKLCLDVRVVGADNETVRRLGPIFVLTAALVVATPVAASAAPPPNLPAEIPTLLFDVSSNAVRPPGFTTNANQAIAVAKTSRTMQALHRREHPLSIFVKVWLGGGPHYWYIAFGYHKAIVAEVDVSPRGRLLHTWTGPLAIAPYARGGYALMFASWWVAVPFSVLFLLPFLDPRRLRRMLHLDALVILSFFVSFALFEDLHLEAAVWMVYPPLVYLLIRMLRIGRGGGAGGGRLAPLLSTKVLLGGLLTLVAARIALSLANGNVTDVGVASVIGAHRITHGLPLYYANAGHGDTYGPIAYLAYMPFELLWPWHGVWDYVPAAHAAAITFDLVTIVGLVALGRRLRPGADGRRLGLALGWAWAACPFTLLVLIQHTNDGLIAMLTVLSLLVFASPVARGAMLGLAAAAKFSPAALLPLFAGRDRRGLKGALVCAASFVIVVVLAIGLYLPPGGLSEFYNHTLGFQLNRPDVFSPWALHPSLDPIKTVLEGAALLLAGLLAFVPRERSMAQVCALAAAVTIAVQLPAVHWFYFYIMWFMPFVLVALLARPSTPETNGDEPEGEDPQETAADGQLRAPALAGV
jgi:hypothetical protein